MAPIPQGVKSVGFFTLAGSAGLLIFTGLAAETSNPFTLFDKLLFVSWALFVFAGFTLSFFLLSGYTSKRLWYASISFWISILIFWLWFDLRNISGTWRGITYGQYWLILGPIAYSVCCIAYFLTKTPRQYFQLNA
jgi:hypothetical protein